MINPGGSVAGPPGVLPMTGGSLIMGLLPGATHEGPCAYL
jgi:hypothetical protein